MSYETKDSGERAVFGSGMQRDVTKDKIDYTLVLDGPMFQRWAELMDRGARKYDKRNWMKARGPEEMARFKESAFRHFIQWYYGEGDEDHAAACIFNINGYEYTREKWAKDTVEGLDPGFFPPSTKILRAGGSVTVVADDPGFSVKVPEDYLRGMTIAGWADKYVKGITENEEYPTWEDE